MDASEVIAVEIQFHLEDIRTFVALLSGIALLILAFGFVMQQVLDYLFLRKLLKKKKIRKALRDLAKVIEAQRGRRRRDRKPKGQLPMGLPPGQRPVPPSGPSSL